MSNEPLNKRVRLGVSLSAVSMCLGQAMIFGRSVIVARFLAPDDFGLFGMAMTIIGGLQALTNVNLMGAFIVNKFATQEEVNAQLDTAWSAEIVRRCIISVLIWASIYPTVHFYGDSRLGPLFILAGVTSIIQGFGNKGLIVLRKKVNFKQLFWFDQSTNIVMTVAAIVCAYITRNVWALVLSQFISAIGSVLLSYAFHPYRPRFAFDKRALKLVMNYGKYSLIIVLMTYITTTADNIMVGKLLGASVLGGYILAYSFANMPVHILQSVLSNVLFPAYAELNGETTGRVEIAFQRVFVLSIAVLIILLVPVIVLHQSIIDFIYGEKWQAAGVLLGVLSIQGLCRGLVHTVSPLLLGTNHNDMEAKAKVWEAGLFLLILYPLTASRGAYGAAWAGVVVYAVAAVVRLMYVRILFPGVFKRVLSIISSAAFAGICGGIGCAIVSEFAGTNFERILLGGTVSTIIIAAVLSSLRQELRREVLEHLSLLILWISARKRQLRVALGLK